MNGGWDRERALEPRLRGMTPSVTLAIQERSRERLDLGLPIARLGLGQSPFPVPTGVVEALRAAAEEKDYLSVRGLPTLRDAIAGYHRRRHGIDRSEADIIVGPGSKELMFLLQIAFAGELLIPTPAWVSYAPQARIAGRDVRMLPTNATEGYRLTPQLLDAACRPEPGRPRILVLNYPSNPTGLSYDRDDLEALAEVVRRYRVVVLSDEIYGELHHRGEHVSIASFIEDATILSTGLSKWCGAGGWRLGTFSFPPALRWLLDALAVLASETFSSTCAPVQYAAVRAFEGGDEIEDYLLRSRGILAALTEQCRARLEAAGADVPAAVGAFYLLPGFATHRASLARRGITNDVMLAERLIADAGIATLPGSSFGLDPTALRLRLALVDFDGRRALAAAPTGSVDTAFVERHCTPTLRAVAALARFVTDA